MKSENEKLKSKKRREKQKKRWVDYYFNLPERFWSWGTKIIRLLGLKHE